jgi:hypothetical protein
MTDQSIVAGRIVARRGMRHQWGDPTYESGHVAKSCLHCGIVKTTAVIKGRAVNLYFDSKGSPLGTMRPLCLGKA